MSRFSRTATLMCGFILALAAVSAAQATRSAQATASARPATGDRRVVAIDTLQQDLLAAGFDRYQVPLRNGHQFSGMSIVSGFGPDVAVPVITAVSGSPDLLLSVWFVISSGLHYGVNIELVGPVGVPCDETW